MSEYQYYEFLALDRPLTDAEYGQVRALSTRAQVNRTRFVKTDGQEADRLLEPPVPPGLGRLTAAQSALVDFLRVNPDLLAAAVSGSPDVAHGAGGSDGQAVDSWVKGLTGKQKDQALRRLLADDDPHARAELLRTARASVAVGTGNARRAVSELLATAAMRADARENARQRELDKQRARREKQVRQERERRLDDLADQGERPWDEVNALIAAKKASAYDSAVALLSDLKKISLRGGDPGAFARRLVALRAAHQRKPSFIDRLDAAGLP